MNSSAIRSGATLAILGTLLSGPVGVITVATTHPQPEWENAAVFLANYHWIQIVPYCFGFLLLLGSLLVVAGARDSMPPHRRALGQLAFGLTSSACTLIFFNYIAQISFLPHQTIESSAMISALSMSNPSSLAWSIEMWAYCLLGLGLWLTYPAFQNSSRLRTLLLINAIMGILGAVATASIRGWPLTRSGMIAFIAWNLVYLILMYCLRIHSSVEAES